MNQDVQLVNAWGHSTKIYFSLVLQRTAFDSHQLLKRQNCPEMRDWCDAKKTLANINWIFACELCKKLNEIWLTLRQSRVVMNHRFPRRRKARCRVRQCLWPSEQYPSTPPFAMPWCPGRTPPQSCIPRVDSARRWQPVHTWSTPSACAAAVATAVESRCLECCQPTGSAQLREEDPRKQSLIARACWCQLCP